MTQAEALRHWQQGAIDALESAQLLHDAGKYALALFHCHLACEKGLKAAFVEQKKDAPPATHNLLHIAKELDCNLSETQEDTLSDLTDYAVDARYDDPEWAKQKATKENSAHWITNAQEFLSTLGL